MHAYALMSTFPGSRLLVAENLSVRQWTSVLKLAAFWQMDDLAGIVVEKLSQSNSNREDWMALLDMSIQHDILESRALAIRKLWALIANGEGTEMVLLARRYQVPDWLERGLQALVQREEFFSDEDERQLGWRTIFRLCCLREQWQDHNRHRRPSIGWNWNLDEEIRQEFFDEFKIIGGEGKENEGVFELETAIAG